MDDIEKKARELLATEYERRGSRTYAESLRVTPLWAFGDDESAMGIRAIIAAITPPEGYVMVPVEPTEAMLDAEHATAEIHDDYGENRYVENPKEVWAAMLAARPEVK